MELKRRLPVWMLGASTVNKTSKPVALDENDEVSVVTESTKPKGKRVSSSEEKGFLVKCETKRKKRGFDENDVVESGERDQEVVVVEKRKRVRVERKVEEGDCIRKAEEEDCEFESSIENEDSTCDEEDYDDELTVEDLLSIAKEFVEKDKSETGQQKPSNGQCETKIESSYTSSAVTKTSPIAPKDTTPPIHEETASHNNSIENTSKVTVAEYKTTEDPAQDMLDLFFGSLLKKPVEKEETTLIKDIIIPPKIKNQQHDAIISNKPVTFTKKKSSLRDAVAMLLD